MDGFDLFAELESMYKNQLGYPHPRVAGLTEAEIQRWSELLGKPRSMLYDEIAMYLARGFHTSRLTFAFCDAIVNDIHGVIVSTDEHRPDLFWKVFLAFDEGEYCHGNNREEDPQQIYTRPMIARIIHDVPSKQ